MRSITWGLMAGCASLALLSASAGTPNWPGPQPLNTYGHTGLLEMPSARVMEDGEFAVTIATAPESFRTTLTFQVFPWLEAAFRYGRINNFFADVKPEKPDLLDRSFSLKVKLLSETEYLPAVAIGMNDIVGTGIYGGEYVVASKNWGDFDFTLGMGWGRMGSAGMFRNPFSYLDDRFDNRPVYDPNNDQGGKPLFNSIFRGRDVSLFGGVVWQTPIDGLKAIVEYSGDAYTTEEAVGIYKPTSQFNFGVSYRYDSIIEGSLAYLYGDTISFRVSVRFDPTVETMKVMEPTPLPPAVRPPEQRPGGAVARVEDVPVRSAGQIEAIGLRGVVHAASDDKWSLDEYAKTGNALLAQNQGGKGSMQEIMTSGRWNDVPAIREQIIASLKALGESQSLGIEAVDLKKDYVAIYYNNTHYIRETDAIHRMLRVLTTLPPSVEHFYLTSVVGGLPSTEVQLTRSAYERAVNQFASVDDLLDYVKIVPGGMEIPDDALRFADAYPRFSWEILPRPRTLLFDPDKPFRLGLTISIGGSVEFEGGWKVEGNWTSDLVDTVDDPTPGNSVLPHVRTDFRLYRDEGQHGIESLFVSKIGKLSPEVFYEAKAGLLEDMFGGVGGEIIWRPQGSNVAWGINAYYLKQRAYDRLFEFQDYDVVTGQVSMYWQDAIWRGVNVNVHAGRYLAGDWGATFEVTRKFESGVEIGAYATLTDVPFNEFGEGSFDKGLIIRVPFGWIAPFNTQYTVSTYLASLTRDGGQRLYDRNPLWEKVRGTNEAEIRRTWKLDVTPGL
jgi:hypothetical protein